MNVVFDTNVYVSAFILPGSQGEQAFLLARRGLVELYSSVPILTETARILRNKFSQPEKDVTAALKMISRASQIVRPSRKVAIVADTADNRILECAVTASADVVVTGDYHLLVLKQFEDIPIVRLSDFLRIFSHSASRR
jgi:putative PIN family toxin of toxin-antitoxin system